MRTSPKGNWQQTLPRLGAASRACACRITVENRREMLKTNSKYNILFVFVKRIYFAWEKYHDTWN